MHELRAVEIDRIRGAGAPQDRDDERYGDGHGVEQRVPVGAMKQSVRRGIGGERQDEPEEWARLQVDPKIGQRARHPSPPRSTRVTRRLVTSAVTAIVIQVLRRTAVSSTGHSPAMRSTCSITPTPAG